MDAKGLPIRDDVPVAELRRLARREKGRAAAARMQAIAGALEGMMRAEAARLAGMERQALRDAVALYSQPPHARRQRGNQRGIGASKHIRAQVSSYQVPLTRTYAGWPGPSAA